VRACARDIRGMGDRGERGEGAVLGAKRERERERERALIHVTFRILRIYSKVEYWPVALHLCVRACAR
jgi:hypothetical protein